ncbi:MAG: hypothetical protein WBP11_06390 [Dokdonella sp.]
MRTLIAAIAVSLFATAPAYAGSLLDLAVIDRDTGETLTTYNRFGKSWIAGTPGHRYAVRLTNRSGARVMAVVSVDGVNAVSGETAGTGQTGYVLDAWQTTEIVGWRKSMDDVAQFNFTSLPNSYAARTDRPTNVGVIGVAVFTEREPVITYREQRRRYGAQPPASAPYDSESSANEAKQEADSMASAADAAAPVSKSAAGEAYAGRSESRQPSPMQEKSKRDERLGTGHGSREDSRVVYTNFTRSSSRPAEQLGIWYDSYRNLVAQGVIVTRPIASNTPNPFPNSFVADPPR